MTLLQAQVSRQETAREEVYSVLENDILPEFDAVLSDYGMDLKATYRAELARIQGELEDLMVRMEGEEEE